MTTIFPPVIIGSGIAGLSVALSLAPRKVIILTRGGIGEKSSSILAQGGIAAAIGSGDSPSLHAEDTIRAGAGLCYPEVVRVAAESAPDAINKLAEWGVIFDRDEQGRMDLGLEGAHSKRRIVHAGGDSTGAEIVKALAVRARATPSISLVGEAEAVCVTTGDCGVTGVAFLRRGSMHHIVTDNVILATGGAGALWLDSTAPNESWGQGLVLAAMAGAKLQDIEFMQFHPTGIETGSNPVPLASESLRGEGAVLINDRNEEFMSGFPRGCLEPRDVVTRAIQRQMQEDRRVFLDVRAISGFPTRFPSVYSLCKAAGIDPLRRPVPVRPVAHYHMGGVAVDIDGRTGVDGLWACGEASSTGLHGANRLASNSLLEAVVFGRRTAEAVLGSAARKIRAPQTLDFPLSRETEDERRALRRMMSACAGVLRHKSGLEQAMAWLERRAKRSHMAFAALMIVKAALSREESRGAHYRSDFPATAPEARHQIIDPGGFAGKPSFVHDRAALKCGTA